MSREYLVTYKDRMDDAIFKALADPARRTLLDALRQRDGQTLQELTELLDMTRFGVMKHLGVLEDAQQVEPIKKGRFKHHYLNAVPLQQTIDRWIEPMRAKPAARAVLNLKQSLERPLPMSKPDFVMQTFIRCTQDALWDALTDPAQMASYHFMCDRAEREGDEIKFILPNGDKMLTQQVTTETPYTRIETTFEPLFFGPGAPASRMAYEIEPQGPQCKLTIGHYDIAEGQEGVMEGWARLASSLKSYLETGEGMRFPLNAA